MEVELKNVERAYTDAASEVSGIGAKLKAVGAWLRGEP